MRQQIFSRLLLVSQADYSVDAILCMVNPDTSVLSVISSLLTIFGIGSNGVGFLLAIFLLMLDAWLLFRSSLFSLVLAVLRLLQSLVTRSLLRSSLSDMVKG